MLQQRWPLYDSFLFALTGCDKINSEALTLQNHLSLINCLLRLNGAFNYLPADWNCIAHISHSKEICWCILSSKVIMRNSGTFVDAKINVFPKVHLTREILTVVIAIGDYSLSCIKRTNLLLRSLVQTLSSVRALLEQRWMESIKRDLLYFLHFFFLSFSVLHMFLCMWKILKVKKVKVRGQRELLSPSDDPAPETPHQ